jgi:hypothetical protein
MAEFEPITEADHKAITQRTQRRMQHRLLAVAARFDRRSQRLMIDLSNGAVVGFPLSVLPGLEQASADDLNRIEVEGRGYGLHLPALDVDIAVPQLLADHLGATAMKRAQLRQAASQANGRLGGRPKKIKAA